MTKQEREFKLQSMDGVLADILYDMVMWHKHLPRRSMREFISKSLIEREIGVRESESTLIRRYELRYGRVD